MTPQLITLYEDSDGHAIIRADRDDAWTLEDPVAASRFYVDAREWLAGRWTPEDDFRRRDWSARRVAGDVSAVAAWHIERGLVIEAAPTSTSVALYLGVEPATPMPHSHLPAA